MDFDAEGAKALSAVPLDACNALDLSSRESAAVPLKGLPVESASGLLPAAQAGALEPRTPDHEPFGLRLLVRESRLWLIEGYQAGNLAMALRLSIVAAVAIVSIAAVTRSAPTVVVSNPPRAIIRQTSGPVRGPALLTPFVSILPPLPPAGSSALSSPAVQIAPSLICDAIRGDDARTAWAESIVFPDEWECISDKAPAGPVNGKSRPEEGSAQAATSTNGTRVFAMARGPSEAMVSYVRLKVSANERSTRAEASAALAQAVQNLFAALGRTVPGALLRSLKSLQPIQLADGGLEIKLMPEIMVAGSYNLIFTFPAPLRASARSNSATAAAGHPH